MLSIQTKSRRQKSGAVGPTTQDNETQRKRKQMNPHLKFMPHSSS